MSLSVSVLILVSMVSGGGGVSHSKVKIDLFFSMKAGQVSEMKKIKCISVTVLKWQNILSNDQ